MDNSNSSKRKNLANETTRSKRQRNYDSEDEPGTSDERCNQDGISRPRGPLPQQSEGDPPRQSSVSTLRNNLIDSEMQGDNLINMNTNSSKMSSADNFIGRTVRSRSEPKKMKYDTKCHTKIVNSHSFKKKVRRNLEAELDAIDAEFDSRANQDVEEIIAPDGIQISVNKDEENEFLTDGEDQPGLDDDKMRDDNFSDADTIQGEECDHESVASSTIITLKPNGPKVTRECSSDGDKEKRVVTPVGLNHMTVVSEKKPKPIAEMTPDELIDANPVLKEWMRKLMNKKAGKGNGNVKAAKAASSAGNQGRMTQQKSQGDKRLFQTISQGETSKNMGNKKTSNLVHKSPSDTTIYAPALKLTPEGQ